MKNMINSATIVLAVIMMFSLASCANGSDHAKFIVDSGFDNVILKNGEGKYLKSIALGDEKNDGLRGDMEVFTNDLFVEDEEDGEDDSDRWLLEILDSDYYSLESLEEDGVIKKDIEFEIRNKHNNSVSIFAEYIKKIELYKKLVTIIGDEGSTFEYSIIQMLPYGKKKAYYSVVGESIGTVKYEGRRNGFILSGAKGKTAVDVFTVKKGGDLGGGVYFLYGQKVKVYKKGSRLIVSPAVRIPMLEKDNVTGVRLRPSNSGKNMFLSWNHVKKAKSYVVYRYDYENGAYKRVAVRNGIRGSIRGGANYLNIKDASPTEKYRYRVAAKSKPEGKGKIICRMSYPVWAVSKDNVYSNATKVTTNKSRIKGKSGKRIKLKGYVEGYSGKTLMTEKLRWYSSDKRIASVKQDTGNVKLKKKGRCEIWAKAHNGKNSQKIKVTVK